MTERSEGIREHSPTEGIREHCPALEGRVAIVTGGSRGIGLAIAEAMHREGAHVVITARKAEQLTVAAQGIRDGEGGGEVLAVVANAGEPDQAQSCLEQTMSRFGRVDVLVNNAATNPYMGPMIGISPAQAEKTVRVNQLAPVLWTRLVWDAWMARHGGSVVNISSIGGIGIDPGIGYYNATKAALLHITRQLAYELGPRARVNAIAPGLVKTEMARAIWEPREDFVAAQLPTRRLGLPADIAAAAIFLAGDASSWITGQTLVVDGGATVLPVALEQGAS
jgi:NAD(P)-dependent dehydrogenase (short-subunit alcohol dehydrogenase family)